MLRPACSAAVVSLLVCSPLTRLLPLFRYPRPRCSVTTPRSSSRGKVPDALVFADDEFVPALLRNLNAMRKNTSSVGKQEIAGHRCVLAGSSQYLLKLFGDEHRQLTCDEAAVKSSAPRRQEPVVYKLSDKLDGEATEALVQFAYTGK
ncbi:hypothetical protein FJT64_018419 [Amphibalanus amphitrite]|uniref:BTB domain-containing protein n=1 Tax=Amphibalanus amphitrite TaxID=1232801 RepID=A0A6A4WXM5_AMPAM|nr:hypothetical protein FJT64_018419 [Amphibalanus amphitrite]